jgi:hypothetical protein
MSPLALELVRRLSRLLLILAALLIIVPPALTRLGLWGPTVPEQIEAAERSLAAARAYGGRDEDAAFAAARDSIAEARAFQNRREEWSARQAARRASAQAIEAQRVALTAREAARRQSALLASDIDRRMGELDDLYSDVTPGLDKETASTLVGVMKEARRKGAGVLLAIEEGDYRRAVAQEPEASQTLTAAIQRLESYRKRPDKRADAPR